MGAITVLAPRCGTTTDQARALTFAWLVLAVVALILVGLSASSSLVVGIARPNLALAAGLPIVATLLSVTLFRSPARELSASEALPGVAFAVRPFAGLAVLLALEALKPIWR